METTTAQTRNPIMDLNRVYFDVRGNDAIEVVSCSHPTAHLYPSVSTELFAEYEEAQKNVGLAESAFHEARSAVIVAAGID